MRNKDLSVKKMKPEIICKRVDDEDLKIKIDNKLFNLFKRSMSAKHEKSTNYILKSIKGEMPTMRIAKSVQSDFNQYEKIVNELVDLLHNE
jgi:hypothetical protein